MQESLQPWSLTPWGGYVFDVDSLQEYKGKKKSNKIRIVIIHILRSISISIYYMYGEWLCTHLTNETLEISIECRLSYLGNV